MGASVDVEIRKVVEVLSRYRFRFGCERDLQAGVAQALTVAGIEFREEVRITPQDRLDFLCGGLAIELKVSGNFTRADLVRQVSRYAQHEKVERVLIVANRCIAEMPTEINGKPVHYHTLLGSML